MSTGQAEVRRVETTGIRAVAGAAYRWLALAYVVCLGVQFLLAGAGVFGERAGVRLEDQKSFDAHRAFGLVLVAGGLLLLVVCLAWWSERIWLMGTFLLALLGYVQFPLAAAGDHHRWVGGLHALNGCGIVLLAGWLAYRAWKRDLAGARPA